MPALDTNVLVRFIVQDDERQLNAAKQLIAQWVNQGHTVFIPITVTLELEWVLRSRYQFTKAEVLRALSNMFSAAELSFESERGLEVALHLYREGAVDFADCLNIALASQAGEAPLFTFDQRAAKMAGAQLILS